nr:hypothetical transcript [Hymenolepis microstoma]
MRKKKEFRSLSIYPEFFIHTHYGNTLVLPSWCSTAVFISLWPKFLSVMTRGTFPHTPQVVQVTRVSCHCTFTPIDTDTLVFIGSYASLLSYSPRILTLAYKLRFSQHKSRRPTSWSGRWLSREWSAIV